MKRLLIVVAMFVSSAVFAETIEVPVISSQPVFANEWSVKQVPSTSNQCIIQTETNKLKCGEVIVYKQVRTRVKVITYYTVTALYNDAAIVVNSATKPGKHISIIAD